MADVFISFIHEEEKIASGVQRFLQKKLNNRDIFLSSDQWQIFAGEIWLDRIRQELETAKVVILLLSDRSVERPWVNFEAGAAWLPRKAVIPVCYGGLSKGALPKPYSDMHALNLREDPYYLVSSLARHLGWQLPPLPFFGPLDADFKIVIDALDQLEGVK